MAACAISECAKAGTRCGRAWNNVVRPMAAMVAASVNSLTCGVRTRNPFARAESLARCSTPRQCYGAVRRCARKPVRFAPNNPAMFTDVLPFGGRRCERLTNAVIKLLGLNC
jgi:hypothetical protein